MSCRRYALVLLLGLRDEQDWVEWHASTAETVFQTRSNVPLEHSREDYSREILCAIDWMARLTQLRRSYRKGYAFIWWGRKVRSTLLSWNWSSRPTIPTQGGLHDRPLYVSFPGLRRKPIHHNKYVNRTKRPPTGQRPNRRLDAGLSESCLRRHLQQGHDHREEHQTGPDEE